jgi:transcriptional regulator with XRE-family HTH domain
MAIEALEGMQRPRSDSVATHDRNMSEVIGTLRQMLTRTPALADLSDTLLPEEIEDDDDVIDQPTKAWGEELRRRREALGLSRMQLAKLAGISANMLRNLEGGRRSPTPGVMNRLMAVKELKLEPTDPLLRVPMQGAAAADLAPNCWLAPGFDSIKMIKEMVLQLNGRGGHVEQSFLYLDHLSSACWCAIADQEDYVAAQSGKPLDRAAAAILRSVNGAGLDIIGMGCGDGKTEVRLVQHLVERGGHGDLRFYMLDISQPLLSAAYKHAADTLADRRGVAMFAIQGNFHDLPRYTQLLYTPERAHRRRVVCMFGYTFGNLQNEILFVRNSLVGFAPGDLLLLDVGLVCAPADQPEEVMKRDPRLSGKLPAGWQTRYEEWLAGPLKRYMKDYVGGLSFTSELDTASCPVSGSYAVEVRANVKVHGGEKTFSIFRVKRYDIIKLVACLRQLGWDPVDGWQYGSDPRVLYLFRCRQTV